MGWELVMVGAPANGTRRPVIREIRATPRSWARRRGRGPRGARRASWPAGPCAAARSG